MLNGLSVDVEEAFHGAAFEDVLSPADWTALALRAPRNTERLLGCFEEAGVQGTFFILGWLAERAPALVRRIADAGHEIACHGHGHRRAYHQSPAVFREDVARAKGTLEDLTGKQIRGYRAPTYSIVQHNLWALDVLAELGFEYDSSIFPIHHDRYGIPGAPRFPHRLRCPNGATLLEVPPTTFRLGPMTLPVAGGGYLRLYPRRVTEAAMCVINRWEGEPAFVYVHPWEVDEDQPRLTARRRTWWRHTVGIPSLMDRLKQLLRRFEFAPFHRVLAGRSFSESITLSTGEK